MVHKIHPCMPIPVGSRFFLYAKKYSQYKIARSIEKKIGNIYSSSLGEIWNSKMMQLYRKKISENNYGDLCDPLCISGARPKEELGRYLLFGE